MRKGAFFTRVFCVVILTVLVTVLCATIVFTKIARNTFTRSKENELFSQAHVIASVYTRSPEDMNGVMAALGSYADTETSSGLCAMVVDKNGLVASDTGNIAPQYYKALRQAALSAMSRGRIRTGEIFGAAQNNMVGIGVAITGASGAAQGAVSMLVPLNNALGVMGSLNSALGMSLLLVMPLMILAAYYVLGRVVLPLKQIRDVAVGMVSGNLEARADDSLSGEMGQLGRSLNLLSQELATSITALTNERNRLKLTLDGLNEGVVSVDDDMRVTSANPAIYEMFKPYAKDYADDEYMSVVPNGQVWTRFKSAMLTGLDDTFVFPLGDSVIQLSVSPLTGEDKKIVGAVGMFKDITESERLERTRRDYVANVSHEMRTPLTAMRAFLEPLSDGMVTDEAARQRYYSIMLRETLRLSRLIDDLMELSRLQSGTLAMPVQPVDITVMAGDLEGKYKPIADDHMLTFENAIPDDCPAVATNPDRLEQVMVILIDNAMKYTPESGKVAISAKWDNYCVTITVSDTGIGIDEKDQPYVFDRFYKVDKAHSGLGSGLGLSIAKEIIELMGESIWLESRLGEGSRFMFTLKRG